MWAGAAAPRVQRRKNSTSETRWRLLRPMTAFEWAIPQRLSARSAFFGPMPGNARSRSRTIAVWAHAGGALSTSGSPTRPARRSRFSWARAKRTSFAWASACSRRSGICTQQVARRSCARHRNRVYVCQSTPHVRRTGDIPGKAGCGKCVLLSLNATARSRRVWHVRRERWPSRSPSPGTKTWISKHASASVETPSNTRPSRGRVGRDTA